MGKIKRSHYRSIYTTHRRRGPSLLKIIIFVVIAAALVFVGYSVADPLMKLFSGNFKTSSSQTQSQSSASKAKPSSSKQSSSSVVKTSASAVKGVYLPKKYLSDTSALSSFITNAKAQGINLIIMDLKAEDGVVNYASKVEDARNTVASGAPDASTAAKMISSAGLTPAARICAFQDPVAPSAIRGIGVMYSGNHSINWLDTSGNRWLNPNSQEAQQYITGLATEAVSLGYKEIFVDSLTFPTKGNPDKTGYFGEMTSKEAVISAYTAALKQKVNAAGGKLVVVAPGAAAVGQAQSGTGLSQDIFSLSGDYISPNFCPSLLTDSTITVGSSVVSKPDLTPANTVSTLAQYVKANDSAKLSVTIPIIQAYTNKEAGYGKYKQYTSSDIKGEITALSSSGISSYILYSPDGSYDLSAIK